MNKHYKYRVVYFLCAMIEQHLPLFLIGNKWYQKPFMKLLSVMGSYCNDYEQINNIELYSEKILREEK